MKAEELCLLTVHFFKGKPGECGEDAWSIKDPIQYITPKSDVEKLMQATLSLHFKPGINPYSKGKTARLAFLTLSELSDCGAYWWSTPGLDNEKDPKGARIWEWINNKDIWVHPNLEMTDNGYEAKDPGAILE